jgi:hypothetical protein
MNERPPKIGRPMWAMAFESRRPTTFSSPLPQRAQANNGAAANRLLRRPFLDRAVRVLQTRL